MNDDIDVLRRRPHGLLEHLRRQTDDTSKAWADWVEAQITVPRVKPQRWHGGGSLSNQAFWRHEPTPAIISVMVKDGSLHVASSEVSPKVLTIFERSVSTNIQVDHMASLMGVVLDSTVAAQNDGLGPPELRAIADKPLTTADFDRVAERIGKDQP